MQRLLYLAAMLAVLANPSDAWSQKKDEANNKQASDIPKGAAALILETEDGVYLSATYWTPKKKGKDVGVVILPNVRTNTQREWYPFAQKLADSGLGAITFDFRGFGQSTTYGPNAKKTSKKDGNTIRNADVLRNAESIKTLLMDLDCIKQFLLRENNEGSINIRQTGLVVLGDLATVISFNWLLEREFGGKYPYTHEGGDIAAVCLIAPSARFKNYGIPTRLPTINEKLPFYLLSASDKSPSGETCDRLAKHLKLPVINPSAAEKRENERRSRPGGWNRIDLKTKKKSADLSIDFVRNTEFKSDLDGVVGFLAERLKFQKTAPWEGPRDVDQGFNIVTSSKP